MRPDLLRWILGVLLAVIAINAFGGGYYGMAGASGVPTEWLEGSPFESYFVPSAVLFVVVGGAFLVAAIGVLAGSRWSRRATAAAVAIACGWLATQLAIIGYVSWLQPTIAMATVTVALLAWRSVPMSASPSDGGYAIARPTFERQLAIDAFAALPPSHLMTALLELDVTEATAAIADLHRRGTRVSMFAFLVRSIAVAMSEHPDLNLIRHGKSLARFTDVDVSVPVEVTTPDGEFPRELVLRKAHLRTPEELYAEIEAARTLHQRTGDAGAEDRKFRRLMRLLRLVPSFVRIAFIRLYMRSAFRVKRSSGTTLVTSVGKFASIPGFAFTFTTGPRAAAFVIGSVVEKPWVHDGTIMPRTIVAVTVMLNHDLIDGAPAARFARRLQQLVESADGLGGATFAERGAESFSTVPALIDRRQAT